MNIALLANWHAVTLPLASDMTNTSCNAKAYTVVLLILSTKNTGGWHCENVVSALLTLQQRWNDKMTSKEQTNEFKKMQIWKKSYK